MSIKSRKHPVVRSLTSHADARTLGLVLATLPGLALAAQPDGREAGDEQLSTVVVTGARAGYKADSLSSPKYTQPLLDTPQSITVITKELLDDQGLGSLADALRNTPSITFTLGENGNTMAGDSITMRGFDVSGSVFLDGVRDLGAVSRDTFNTEQIEIVKGSAGSDIGRATPTGYINMSSKQPVLQDAASSKLAYGNHQRLRAEADLNHALGWQGAAARLNVMYDRTDIAGRSVADKSRWGLAPALALGLGSETRAYFNYLFVKQINTPDGGLPPVGLGGYNYVSSIAAPTGATAEQVTNVNNLNAAITAAVAAAPAVDRRNFYGSLDDFEHVRANQFTFRFEHDFSEATTLRNTSRYGRQSMRRLITGVNTLGNLFAGTATSGTATVNDSSAWTLSRARQRRDEVNEVLTNQTNLSTALDTGPVGHALSTGVEFIYERQQNLAMTNPGTNVPANLYDPNTDDTFLVPVPSGGYNDGNTLTVAAYLFDTMQITEKFSITAGVRFDKYRTEYASVPPPATPPAASVYAEAAGELFSGKLGLVFKPLENGSIYAVAASSQLPPGGSSTSLNSGANNMFVVAGGTANNINNPNLDPQKARNLELGTKWELFGRKLIVTAAAFDTRNKNDLTQQDPVTLEITQFGERKVRGFELSAAGLLARNWQLSAGFASLDTEVVEGTTTGNNPTQGAQLQFTPKTSFTSWTSYTFPFGLSIGGGARYTASQFRNGSASQATVSNLAVNPSVWLFDAMASYTISERISVQLNVQNLTNEFYFASINNGGSRFVLGAPRTVLLSGEAKFY